MSDVERILRECRTWAVVGWSPGRPSAEIAAYLEEAGYVVHRVHPTHDGCFRRVHDIPGRVDCVDVFRRSSEAGAHVDEAIAIGAKAVWLQLGVRDEAAGARARAAGLLYVENRCPAIERPRLAA